MNVRIARDGHEIGTYSDDTLGPEHADTLASVTNLAIVLAERGNHQEAKSLCSRALEVNARILGATHLDTLNSTNNLAYESYLLGDYVAAEPLFKRALEGFERILGADHPDTLNVLIGYAVMLNKSGDHSHAVPLFRKALGAYGRASFRIHHDTMHELAKFAHEHGDHESAEDWCRRALDSRELKLGKDHPDTLASAKTLWAILRQRGDPEAERIRTRFIKDEQQEPGQQK